MNTVSPLTILMINFHSAYNAGDAALLESAIRQLRSSFYNPKIIVSANYPDETFLSRLGIDVVPSFTTIAHKRKTAIAKVLSFILGLFYSIIHAKYPKLPTDSRNEFIRDLNLILFAYKRADLVVGCPGNQFFSMGKVGFPFLLMAASVYLAHVYQKPFYVMPQSIGPLNRFWERWLLRWLYSKGRLIFLRDYVSLRLAKEVGLPDLKIRYAPDLAFDYPIDEIGASEFANILRAYNSCYGAIGITVIRRMVRTLHPEVMEHYYVVLANALKRMLHRYPVRIYFFPQVTGPTHQEDDRIAAKIVMDKMGDVRQFITHIDVNLSPQILKTLYSYMDIFIASRLHSGIFALSATVPTLFIGYLTKTRGVLEAFEMNEWVIDIAELDEDRLFEKIEELWLKRAEIKEHLAQRVSNVVNQVRRVGHEIALDFQQYLSESHG